MTFIDPLSRALHHQAGQHGPLILMYHAVASGSSDPAWPWAVSMRNFCAQLDFLAAEGYATPTMGELASAPPGTWKGRTAVITFDDGYVDNLAACEALKQRNMRATWFIVSGSVGKSPQWPEDGRPPGRLLNASELASMQQDGMEIGSHTVSHARLTEVDRTKRLHEIRDSRAALEDILGQAVGSFAYPYGLWNAKCAEAVEAAGYAAACTTRPGWALRDNTPYLLRRLTVFNTDSLSTFARKLYFGGNDVSWKALTRYGLLRMRQRAGL